MSRTLLYCNHMSTEHEHHSPDNSAEHLQRIEDIKLASKILDPNNSFNDTISVYNERSMQVEAGMTTEYDPESFDNDVAYSDIELAELHRELQQTHEEAIVAIAKVIQAKRAVDSRRRQLRDEDLDVQQAAKNILGAEEVTIADIFPSEK
jgi:hypothetical protein